MNFGCMHTKKTGQTAAMTNTAATATTDVNALARHSWQLMELGGKAFNHSAEGRSVTLSFDVQNGVISGFAGCNNFRGSFTAAAGNRIRFATIAATKMACSNLEGETEFLRVLENADNYTIADSILSLHKARMAPLARFKAAPAARN